MIIKKIAAEMASIRVQRAQLLGYKTHADFVLENFTAKTPENVYGLLDKVWPAALNRAKEEVADMQKVIDAEGGKFKLEAWDWWYYADKVRVARYAFDEEETRPYFSVDATVNGIFHVAKQLFGITFKERHDVPVYQKDVRVFDVMEADGKVIGMYMMDMYCS